MLKTDLGKVAGIARKSGVIICCNVRKVCKIKLSPSDLQSYAANFWAVGLAMILQLREQNRLPASSIHAFIAPSIVAVGVPANYLAVNHLQIFEKSRWPTKFSPKPPFWLIKNKHSPLCLYKKKVAHTCVQICMPVHEIARRRIATGWK